MTLGTALAVMGVAAPLVLNLWATRVVARDELSDPRQRRAQWVLVWLLPLAGALLVLAVHRTSKNAPGQGRSAADPGDDGGASGVGVRALREALDGD